MAIELVRKRSRRKIGWLRDAVPADAELAFKDREYAVATYTDEQLEESGTLSGLSAVVLTQNETKRLVITRDLERHGRRLLDYDCRIIIRSASTDAGIINTIDELMLPTAALPEKDAKKLRKWQKPEGEPPLPYARYFPTTASWNEIANTIAERPAGDAPNLALKIRVDKKGKSKADPLSAESTLLLQRAFADCSELHLTPLDDGKSGVKVYRACAELTGGLFGQWPQPHFIKIGDRNKVFAEYEVYEGYVDPYVPFHLGPHLIRDRCCLGARQGVIVGDYVEESESLRYCAYDGRSASAIACLFDRTLLGWHRQASRVEVSMAEGLIGRFPRSIDPDRMVRARKLGAKREVAELRALFELCDSKPVLAGPIHGDLHAANVRVRATDAIVIDFFAHGKAPLLYDAATLEASLLVEGFTKSDKNIKRWFDSILPLYDHSPLDSAIVAANPKSNSFWFHACVMQIRRYARQWELAPNQYAAALALALLVKAKKDPTVANPEGARRAAAYVFAERVLLKSFGAKAKAASGSPPQQKKAVAL